MDAMMRNKVLTLLEAADLLLKSNDETIEDLAGPLMHKAAEFFPLNKPNIATIRAMLIQEFGENPDYSKKIDIIKRHREITGSFLKDSKIWVEQTFNMYPR